MQATHVIIKGDVFEYSEKLPYVTSGVGLHGVMAYDRELDKVQCNECGEWFKKLSQHIPVHGMTTSDYRRAHGLNRKSPLAVPSIVETMRANLAARTDFRSRGLLSRVARRAAGLPFVGGKRGRDHERANIHGKCQAQLMASFYSLRDRLGRTPSYREFSETYNSGNVTYTIAASFDKTWAQFCEYCGSIPNKAGPRNKWSTAAIIELLRDFFVKNGRVPGQRDSILSGRQLYRNCRSYFGSFRDACVAAGLTQAYEQQQVLAERMRLLALARNRGGNIRGRVSNSNVFSV
jgi:ROS/MUCR transcriptional regulator protein